MPIIGRLLQECVDVVDSNNVPTGIVCGRGDDKPTSHATFTVVFTSILISIAGVGLIVLMYQRSVHRRDAQYWGDWWHSRGKNRGVGVS